MTKTISAPALTSNRFQTRPADHRFFSLFAIVASAAIVGGFGSTYGPKVVHGTPVPWIIHLHAVIFASWLAVFIAQTTLVLAGRTDVHRRLGVASIGLAALMLVVGIATAISEARLGHRGIPGVEFPDAEGFLLLNINATLVFATLVAAGWYFRRNSQAHKRLMVMAVAGALVGPGVSRLPFVSGNTPLIGGLVIAFLLAGPLYDLVTRRRIHPAYICSFLLAVVAIPPVAGQLASTAAWHRLASWLIR